jgi:hypothetical protein
MDLLNYKQQKLPIPNDAALRKGIRPNDTKGYAIRREKNIIFQQL